MRSATKSASHNNLATSPITILRVPVWSGEDWLVHGFSTRTGGVSEIAGASRPGADLNLGFTARDSQQAVRHNREKFFQTLIPNEPPFTTSGWGMVTLKQMHSSVVRQVGWTEIAERASLWGDGMVTAEPGVLLGIQTADCLPILLADPHRRAVGAFHAGWRGTLKGIVERGVASMVREFGSKAEDIIAAIGPGIGKCCFAVGGEVRDLFAARYPYFEELFSGGTTQSNDSQPPDSRADAPLSMDLVAANRRQLLTAGLKPESIFALDACTSCRTAEFFSYRAERGTTGRLMAVIGINPS
jgi:polyphenol oxidase